MISMARLMVLVFLALVATGCNAPQATESRTRGVEMTMYARGATGTECLYHIKRDGTLSFGGGMDARLESPKWTGEMSDDEIAQMRALLEQCNWFKPTPKTGAKPAEQDQTAYRVELLAPGVLKNFRVNCEHPMLQPLRLHFEKIALRRLEPQLRRLPQPSIREHPSATMPAHQ